MLAGLAGCGPPDGDYFGRVAAPDRIDPAHFTWCSQGEPDHLDPTLAWSTASIQLVVMLFDGLTTYGAAGQPVPGLATDWEIAGDLRRFTFHLRRDARWSSGRPVTAYDVAHSAFRVAHPLTGSSNADWLAWIRGATAYLERRALVLRRAVGPYRAGEVVEATGEVPDVNARTGSRPLALRDLGAPPGAAYAVVPAGSAVTLMMTTGGRATLPSPDGAPWAYVFWSRDLEGVGGWVPAAELDGEPNGDAALQVRGAPGDSAPTDAGRAGERGRADRGSTQPATGPEGAASLRPVIRVSGRDVVHSTDAIGIAVPDPYTIVFETGDPTPYFVALTAGPVFAFSSNASRRFSPNERTLHASVSRSEYSISMNL